MRSQAEPFFAPSTDADIDAALSLAELRSGERFVDLGCGDGQVLAAACTRGATSIGIELDHALVCRARDRLAFASAAVYEADMYTVDLNDYRPDVVFTFLTHASLQSLSPQLLELRHGTRVVSVGTPVPGWVPTKTKGAVFLYEMPPALAPIGVEPSWRRPGMAFLLPASTRWICSFEVLHPPGRAEIRPSRELVSVLSIRLGRAHLPVMGLLGIDMYWSPQPADTCVIGSVESDALGNLPIVAIYSVDGPFRGVPWTFDATGKD